MAQAGDSSERTVGHHALPATPGTSPPRFVAMDGRRLQESTNRQPPSLFETLPQLPFGLSGLSLVVKHDEMPPV